MRRALLVLLGASPAHAQAPPCVSEFLSAEAVGLEGNSVRFCDDEAGKKQKCFTVDLATGKTASTQAPQATAAGGSTLEIDGKRATACTADNKCKTLAPKARVDAGLGMHGEVLGNLVVLVNLAQIETFDLKTGKRIAGFSAGKAGLCTDVTILAGDVLLVQNEECGNDGTMAESNWFATPKGKRIATVGGKTPIHTGSPFVIDTHAAFVTSRADEVVVQDVKTGKIAKRIVLGKPADLHPAITGDDKRLVVVFGGARAGDVAVIDLATDKLATFPATRCK